MANLSLRSFGYQAPGHQQKQHDGIIIASTLDAMGFVFDLDGPRAGAQNLRNVQSLLTVLYFSH
jgi:hypothetical protein